MRDEPEPPSEADGSATWVASVRGAPRGEIARAGRWPWIARILRGIGLVAAGGLTVFGFFWKRSLDLDLDLGLGEASPHLGFHGQRLPESWVCSEGHQHYSIPFWMGGLILALAAVALGWIQRRLVPASR
jgi:hypothetical protein